MSTILDNTKRLIAPWPFARLCNSRDLYPQATGTGLPLLKLDTPLCQAVIALQGAQLLEFIPKGGSPLLWLSPHCHFGPGTALRGGIPVCLPWFGINQRDPGKPKHGFARNRDWQLNHIEQKEDGRCQLDFILDAPADALFSHHFSAHLVLTLGTSAHLALTVVNHSHQAMPCSWAFHSYHPVSSLSETSVLNLAGRYYLDNLEGLTRKQQLGDLVFAGEVDRVFPDVETSLTIRGKPTILLQHDGSPSVITWNPGGINARAITDIGKNQEQHFICVERGAVFDEEWILAPGETRNGWLEIMEYKPDSSVL